MPRSATLHYSPFGVAFYPFRPRVERTESPPLRSSESRCFRSRSDTVGGPLTGYGCSRTEGCRDVWEEIPEDDDWAEVPEDQRKTQPVRRVGDYKPDVVTKDGRIGSLVHYT